MKARRHAIAATLLAILPFELRNESKSEQLRMRADEMGKAAIFRWSLERWHALVQYRRRITAQARAHYLQTAAVHQHTRKWLRTWRLRSSVWKVCVSCHSVEGLLTDLQRKRLDSAKAAMRWEQYNMNKTFDDWSWAAKERVWYRGAAVDAVRHLHRRRQQRMWRVRLPIRMASSHSDKLCCAGVGDILS